MRTLVSLLVGSHFHPPAKQLLACLPSGCRLLLEAEPENPYDPEAIQVFLPAGQLPESQFEKLEPTLAGTGWDLDEVLAQSQLVLGHVARTGGKPLQGTQYQGTQEFLPGLRDGKGEGKLGFGADGKFLVIFQLPAETGETGL